MIDDFKRPMRRKGTVAPTKINTQVFKPGTPPTMPVLTRPSNETIDIGEVPEQPATKPEELDVTTEQGKQASDKGNDSKPPKKSKKFWLTWSKKKRIIVAVVAAVVLIGIIVSALLLFKSDPAPKENKKKPAPEVVVEDPKYYSTLSGLEIEDPAINARPVTAVMIENSQDARPQAGLKEAGVVFEAIAEGGITRFLAVYQDQEPQAIGPIRSARPYYVQWARGFDANYVHAGGSAQGLQEIKNLKVRDLEHGVNGSSFQRVTYRYAPHNLYSNLTTLRELGVKKGFSTSTYNAFERKDDTLATTITAKNITMDISSANFKAAYAYDASTNSYLRNVGGAVHADEKSGSQLAPKVVIALITDYSKSDIYSVYRTTGSGQAVIFQDGIATTATWQKPNAETNISFVDDGGRAIEFNRGQAWITVLPGMDKLSYAP